MIESFVVGCWRAERIELRIVNQNSFFVSLGFSIAIVLQKTVFGQRRAVFLYGSYPVFGVFVSEIFML